MLRAGCCAYLLKDMHPAELEKALYEIFAQGFFNADSLNLRYRKIIANDQSKTPTISNKDRIFETRLFRHDL